MVTAARCNFVVFQVVFLVVFMELVFLCHLKQLFFKASPRGGTRYDS